MVKEEALQSAASFVNIYFRNISNRYAAFMVPKLILVIM